MRETQIFGNGSVLRGPIAFIIGLLLWLSPVARECRASNGDLAVAHASTVTLALPAVPGRLGRVAISGAGDHSARDASHWHTPVPASIPGFLPLGASRLAIPARNERISHDALALTFPYDATAPPAFLRN
jgi:hypothetical protein